MGWLWILLAVPLICPLAARLIWSSKITWTEMILQMVIAGGVVSAIFFMGRYSATSDTEVWNGQVTGKEKLKVSCEHSYECNCVESCSGTGSNRSCTKICQTCYDHSYDIDWRVYTNIGDFNINRVDRQGLRTPKRWSQVEKGQPVSNTHSYTNWVKAVPESMFNFSGDYSAYDEILPEYPLKIYDYQYIDRVIPVGITLPDLKQWNYDLAMELRYLGPNKQANIVMVITNQASEMFAEALKMKWIGGKKNDIVITMGVTDDMNIRWVKIFSWSKTDMINVALRDKLLAVGKLDREKVIAIVRNEVYEDYIRRPMKEFEYLKEEIEPTTGMIIGIMIVGLVLSGLLTWFFHTNDINEVVGRFGNRRRRFRF